MVRSFNLCACRIPRMGRLARANPLGLANRVESCDLVEALGCCDGLSNEMGFPNAIRIE